MDRDEVRELLRFCDEAKLPELERRRARYLRELDYMSDPGSRSEQYFRLRLVEEAIRALLEFESARRKYRVQE